MITIKDIVYILDDTVKVDVELNIIVELETAFTWHRGDGTYQKPYGTLDSYTVIEAQKLDNACTPVDWTSFKEEIDEAVKEIDLNFFVEKEQW